MRSINEKTVGAIDLGSNSLRLLVTRSNKGSIRTLYRELRETRLGEGLIPGEKLNSKARERTLQALSSLLRIMKAKRVDEGVIAATSAVREAADGAQLLDDIAAFSPFPVRLLSGEDEAVYGFRGAVRAMGPRLESNEEDVLVLDLGGRSTELSWREKNIFSSCSLPFGAVNMRDRFLVVLNGENTQKVKEYIFSLLNERSGLMPGKKRRILVGLGGTVTTLAALSLKLRRYVPGQVHCYQLSREEIKKWEQTFLYSSSRERVQMLPFSPKRADIIPAGTSALLSVMEYLGYGSIVVSEGGLLLGIILELYGKVW